MSEQDQPPETDAYSDNSRGRIRHFVDTGQHPESLPEVREGINAPLRSGEPFPFVIAIIPAYNEQESILRTIASLRNQTRRPDEIIVLADNCTDETIALALHEGVSVAETISNGDAKAGGLNALLEQLLPLLDDADSILVMDADTVLTERFIESTVATLFGPSKKPIAGVGGIFLADDDEWSLVRQLQANEYVRYQRRLSRRHGRALVLTGTGTVFTVGFLRAVRQARIDGRLPDLGETQGVYDTSALTEDNELTLSAKQLGYRVVSPKDCTVKTAMMPSWNSLYKQRRRWQRGALENLIAHGLNRHTFPYALRQVLTYLGVVFLPFYVYTLVIALSSQSSLNFFQPIWVAVALLYLFEQTFSVRKGGWRAVLVSLAIIPELCLNIFLDAVYVITLYGTLLATNETWGRVRNLNHETLDRKGRRVETLRRPTASELHGTHLLRQHTASRVTAGVLLVFFVGVGVAAILVPLFDLQLAWSVIAIYVLVGSIATIGRLIPVTTS